MRPIIIILFSLFFSFNSFCQEGTKATTRIENKVEYTSQKSKNKEVAFLDIQIKKVGESDYYFVYLVSDQISSKKGKTNKLASGINGEKFLKINNEDIAFDFENGLAIKQIDNAPKNLYLFSYQNEDGSVLDQVVSFTKKDNGSFTTKQFPRWLSIIPPLLAIFLALITKRVLPSLFIGIWSGAYILNGFTFKGIFTSFYNVLNKYILNAVVGFQGNSVGPDKSHISIIVFSLLIGGMVAIISRNGGMKGIVNRISVFAKNAKRSQLATYFLGLFIFFDDYANTLIVGNTMRPVTDRFNISREKLAYLVDSTAAPIAAIAFITTWIGAELGYISDAISTLGINESVYSLFFRSLAYSYYPIFTLMFMLLLILFARDYGPMLKAERRARFDGILYLPQSDGQTESVDDSLKSLEPAKNEKPRAVNALIPILVVILGTLLGMFISSSGYEYSPDASPLTNLANRIGESDSYLALLWSSLSAVVVAILMSVFNSKMKLGGIMESMVDGMKTMLPAILILIMAWALAQITDDLFTANYLGGLLNGNVEPRLLPILIFILSGLVAFATGSSWGTMSIIYPLALPIAYNIASNAGLPPDEVMTIFYHTISVVLAGAVFGDHCSPISDTTILSSLASSCHHIDHVRTQIWYALTVGLVSCVSGGLLFYLKYDWWICSLAGVALLFAFTFIFGRKVDAKNYILKRERSGKSIAILEVEALDSFTHDDEEDFKIDDSRVINIDKPIATKSEKKLFIDKKTNEVKNRLSNTDTKKEYKGSQTLDDLLGNK